MKSGVDIENIWRQIDHRLADRKIAKLNDKIYGNITAIGTQLRKEMGVDDPTIPIRLVNLYLNALGRAIKSGCQIYRSVWKIQGKAESAAFIRTLYKKVVLPRIDQHVEHARKYCPPKPPFERELKSSLKGLEDIANRYKADWSNICETRALELEHVLAFSHSDDYRSVILNGKQFTLTPTQAQIIKILHAQYKKGTPEVSKDFILVELEAKSSRFPDIFKQNKEARRELIKLGSRKGTYRLNLP